MLAVVLFWRPRITGSTKAQLGVTTPPSQTNFIFKFPMTIQARDFDVIIAGGGPAGSSASIHLASQGARVLVIEQKKFPRAKLCGEFISPECLDYFARLGVADRMSTAGGTRLLKTVFYGSTGRCVTVPSDWFEGNQYALGLSRSKMDTILLERAKELNVTVLEEARAGTLLIKDKRVVGLSLGSKDSTDPFTALVTIDATGRSRSLARQLDNNAAKKPAPFIAFQAHVKGTRLEKETCEIYFYPGGYGGFSIVEHGLYNACFIVSTADVKAMGSDVKRVVNEVVCKNSRAAYTFGAIEPVSDWQAVALDRFGHRDMVPAYGLLTIGDAAAFIDPFTGSGILMALESGELAAGTLTRNLEAIRKGGSFDVLAQEYLLLHQKRFNSRLRMSGLLRRAAFIPQLAEAVIFLVGASKSLRRAVARATHHSSINE